MNQYDATALCVSQGAHLPSARELAQLSMSLGAAGIKEISQYKNEDGYHLIQAQNSDGTLDKFYFSNVGYKRPAGDLGNDLFWSSSVHPYDSYVAYGFSGGKGGVAFVPRRHYFNSAILCVAGR